MLVARCKNTGKVYGSGYTAPDETFNTLHHTNLKAATTTERLNTLPSLARLATLFPVTFGRYFVLFSTYKLSVSQSPLYVLPSYRASTTKLGCCKELSSKNHTAKVPARYGPC